MESRRTDTPARARRQSSRKPAISSQQPAKEARPFVIPESTPHYKSFADIRNPKVRRAKEYEQYLQILQAMFPEYSTGIDEQIAYARSQQDRSRVSDRDRVLKQLGSCDLSCRELSDDLRMPYATCYKILMKLAESGMVAIYQIPGRAGNKPVNYFSLTRAL